MFGNDELGAIDRNLLDDLVSRIPDADLSARSEGLRMTASPIEIGVASALGGVLVREALASASEHLVRIGGVTQTSLVGSRTIGGDPTFVFRALPRSAAPAAPAAPWKLAPGPATGLSTGAHMLWPRPAADRPLRCAAPLTGHADGCYRARDDFDGGGKPPPRASPARVALAPHQS